MIRRIEQTVRFPVARMAPTARNWALTQVRLENSGAKAAKKATISGGRSTAVVSRGDGSSTTVDLGQRPPGSASQLGQSRVGRKLALSQVWNTWGKAWYAQSLGRMDDDTE